jgi:hypothetical protein
MATIEVNRGLSEVRDGSTPNHDLEGVECLGKLQISLPQGICITMS